ncbi:MAG: hypothetical protein KKG99_16340 [Bacteroidetes bacterium]|nr:hypothetical protein [Bacteroidota bacterium]
MITIPELVAYSDNAYARTEEQCVGCQNENCEGRCSRCFYSIHQFNSTRDYDCINLVYHYVCEYIYSKSSEISHLFNRHAELRQLAYFNILSIGCGPASELFGINNILPQAHITYKGFDLNPNWEGIHNTIQNSAEYDPNRNVEFYTSNVFEDYPTLNFIPNILILSYLVSHLPKADINVNDFFNELEVIINTMPNNSFIIFNDTNHYRVRDKFDILLNNLNRNEGFVYNATRYRFKGYQHNGIRHNTDELIVDIPQEIRDKYETWRECGSTSQMVIKKEIQ